MLDLSFMIYSSKRWRDCSCDILWSRRCLDGRSDVACQYVTGIHASTLTMILKCRASALRWFGGSNASRAILQDDSNFSPERPRAASTLAARHGRQCSRSALIYGRDDYSLSSMTVMGPGLGFRCPACFAPSSRMLRRDCWANFKSSKLVGRVSYWPSSPRSLFSFHSACKGVAIHLMADY